MDAAVDTLEFENYKTREVERERVCETGLVEEDREVKIKSERSRI